MPTHHTTQNIQGIKAQLAQDDLSALFDETGLPPSQLAPTPPVPPPSLPAGLAAPPSSTPSAPPEQQAGLPLQEVEDVHGALLQMVTEDDDSLLAVTTPSHRAQSSSTASASSILSYSLPAPPHSATGSSPSSPPPLVGGGGRDSRSWSASFSSMAMSPIDRPRANIPAVSATAHTQGGQDGGSGSDGSGNSAICESGVVIKDGGAGVLLPSPARGPRSAGGSVGVYA